MNEYSLAKLYEVLHQDLVLWISDNKKLRDQITAHNIKYLFEFHKKRGLAIDLCRFEKSYYVAVFHPPEEKLEVITEFVKKVSIVMQRTLKRLGKEEISLTIIIRHKVSEVTYWRTCYIGENFNPNNISDLTRKLEDWQ